MAESVEKPAFRDRLKAFLGSPGVVPALIVFGALLIHGLMVWQPWATPEAGKVVTWQSPGGASKETVMCVAYKDDVTCNWR